MAVSLAAVFNELRLASDSLEATILFRFDVDDADDVVLYIVVVVVVVDGATTSNCC